MATQAKRGHNRDQTTLKQEVYALLKQYGVEDWDGEGALPISADTVALAQKLVDCFPDYIDRPDVSASPHGEVDFDWAVSKDVMLSLAVCPSGEIAFAGLFYGSRLNGSEPWHNSLPHFVESCFQRLRIS